MTDPKKNARSVALDALLEIFERDGMSHLVLRRAFKAYPELDRQQRAFIARIVEGTVERRLELDYVIDQFSHTPVPRLKPVIRGILRMSVYQLLYMDAVPDAAICNEAVKLAAKRGYVGLKGFVNGVLRNIAAKKDRISYPPESTPEGLSVRYSMPQWIVEGWTADYGTEATRRMLPALLKERPLIVHRSVSKEAEETVRESLLSQGIEVKPHPYDRDAWILQGAQRLEGVEAFDRGWIQVQDISSQLASRLAVRAMEAARAEACKKAASGGTGCGLRILDVCAAPGGKSVYVADAAAAEGLDALVCARDISEEKAERIRQNKRRLGLDNLKAEVWDALIYDASWEGQADVLIADLPCSGLGIAARKGDIKYRMTRERQQELIALQRRILSVIWRYVRPGGYLIYSTCTIHRGENEENFKWFLEEHPFHPVDISGWLPEALGASSPETVKSGYMQLLPGIHDSDGFFLSALKREGKAL